MPYKDEKDIVSRLCEMFNISEEEFEKFMNKTNPRKVFNYRDATLTVSVNDKLVPGAVSIISDASTVEEDEDPPVEIRVAPDVNDESLMYIASRLFGYALAMCFTPCTKKDVVSGNVAAMKALTSFCNEEVRKKSEEILRDIKELGIGCEEEDLAEEEDEEEDEDLVAEIDVYKDPEDPSVYRVDYSAQNIGRTELRDVLIGTCIDAFCYPYDIDIDEADRKLLTTTFEDALENFIEWKIAKEEEEFDEDDDYEEE